MRKGKNANKKSFVLWALARKEDLAVLAYGNGVMMIFGTRKEAREVMSAIDPAEGLPPLKVVRLDIKTS